jgi:hypothetical protein
MQPTQRSPRHTRRLAAILAVTAAAAPALASGPAHAVPARDPGAVGVPAQPAPASPMRDSGAANNGIVTSSLAGTAGPAAAPDPAPVAVRTVGEGFDWGAAGIGAGGAAALALLGLAGMQARTRGGAHLAR